MDASEIRRLKPKLSSFLSMFADCFARRDTREHLTTYVQGQLSDLERKSVEPIALQAGVPPRTLQNFLSLLSWDQERMRDRVAEIVVREHTHPQAVGIIDETSDDKQGDKTPGVQRQWCGSRGKTENCIVTVHLAYATPDFHCLLDGDLFLPEGWSADRPRCRAAGVPDEVEHRPKWKIALELYDQARANGVCFRWITFDEGYGGKPEFLRALTARQQWFVGEVPASFTGWVNPPEVTERPWRKAGRGRPRRTPRLKAGSLPACRVDHLLKSAPALRRQPWVRYRVKNGQKGAIVWEVKHVLLFPKNQQGLPGEPLRLIVARNPLDGEVKYFVSNAPAEEPIEMLLLVAFSRWKVERCFEDHKGEVGLDHYEGRSWLGLRRHLILCSVSYLFLARVQQELRGKKSGPDHLPGPSGGLRPDTVLVA
jgi:SRSO17 transposase